MKLVGYWIKEPGRDPLYPRYDLDAQDITPADRARGYSSEPVYTLTDEEIAMLSERRSILIGSFIIGLLIGFLLFLVLS